ncbi:MAG: hypothetical protein KGZ94_07695 [Clostridia bacterium]|nr:hypothetical protein [Clostridia bacterium]
MTPKLHLGDVAPIAGHQHAMLADPLAEPGSKGLSSPRRPSETLSATLEYNKTAADMVQRMS